MKLRHYNEHAQHFVGGNDCAFFLGTVVNGSYLVSTVGEWRGGDELGFGRTYETMVFKTTGKERDEGCCPEISDWESLDMDGYTLREDAERGHAAMVEKWGMVDTPSHQQENDE